MSPNQLRWNLKVFWICISLIVKIVEHCFQESTDHIFLLLKTFYPIHYSIHRLCDMFFGVYFFQFFTYYRYLPSTRCIVDKVLSHSVGCLFTWILFPFLCRSHLLHVILFVIPWDYLLCCWSPCQNVLAYAYDLKCVNYVLRHSLVLIFICYYAWHGNTLSPKHLPLSIS